MRSLHPLALILPLVASQLTPPTASAQTSQPATTQAAQAQQPPTLLDQLRQEHRAEAEQRVAPLPMLGSFKASETVQLSLHDGILDLRTTLPRTEGACRIDVTDMPGIATVRLNGEPGRSLKIPQGMDFSHKRFDAPGAALVSTSLLAEPNHIGISRDIDRGDSTVSVQYIQSWRMAAQGEQGVRLYISGMNSLTGNMTQNLRLAAADFNELRRRYPREVAEYLQPIFRDLHQEQAIFSIDPRLGWQAFAEDWQPDEQTLSKLQSLLAKLDSDSFQERESAVAEMEKMGQPAALTLMNMDRKGWSEEQISRVDAFIAAYNSLPSDQGRKLKRDPHFLLDCLYSEDAALRTAALNQLQIVLGRPIDFDNSADTAARYDAVAKLRSSLLTPSTTRPTTTPLMP